jgi:predicted nucleic acid-binding protein
MPADVFFDTNVLIYAIAERDARSARAEALLLSGGVISIQGLNEFVSVARRKIGMPWEEIEEALDAILVLCPSPVPVTLETHRLAMKLARRYSFSIYDALVAAAALSARCTLLYSEDFQSGQIIDGQIIDGKLTIRNPFS